MKCVRCLHTLLCSPQCRVRKNKCDRVKIERLSSQSLFMTINLTIWQNVSKRTKYSTLPSIVSLCYVRLNDDWNWAHFYSQTKHKQNSRLVHVSRAHCLLTNVRIFCWPHTKITLMCKTRQQHQQLRGHLLSENILSTYGISMNRQNIRWKIALYRIRPWSKFESFV